MSEVQYITFENGAPDLVLPSDYTTPQIQDYLKSQKFTQQMFDNGFGYVYGMTPVNLRDEDNLNDNALQAGAKSAVDTLKQIGQGALAVMYDTFGAEEKQAEAIQLVKQYQLDQQAHKWRRAAGGGIKQRIDSLEQVFENEHEFSAFLEWLGAKVGEGAVTSVPFFLAAAVTGGIGAGAIGAGLVARQAGMSAVRQAFTKGLLGKAGGGLVSGTLNRMSTMSSLGLLASGYTFGAGDTYVNQLEETDDPNAAISLAAGVPYALAESALGAGGFLLRTMIKKSSSDAVKNTLQTLKKGKPVIIDKNIKAATKGDRLKAFGSTILQSSSGEAVAEGLQESITQTGQAVEGGRSLQELYSSADFWKQVGEGAAAGFAGGGPFGTVGGTFQAMKVGPSMDIRIKGSAQNILLPKITTDMALEPEIWEALDFKPADVVTYTGAPVQTENTDETTGENYNQPDATDNPTRTYFVAGTADFNGNKYVALVATDNKTELFVPAEGANNILNLEIQAEDTSANNDFIFNDDQSDNVNVNQKDTDKEFQLNIESIRKRGYNIGKKELGVDNDSKKQWVNDKYNNVKFSVDEYQKLHTRWNEWNKTRPNMRDNFEEYPFYDIDTGTELEWNEVVDQSIGYKIPGEYKQYIPYFDDEKSLKAQLSTQGWQQERLRRARNAAINYNKNIITVGQRNDLNELGYDSEEGQKFINGLLEDEYYLESGGTRSRGRNLINDLIKKKVTFGGKKWKDWFEDAAKTKQKIKNEVPLNEVPSIDRIGPATLQEFRTSLLGEGLYEMSVSDRLNAILTLVEELDTVRSSKFRRGVEKTTINQLKISIAQYKKAGATKKLRRAQAALEIFLDETYLLSNASGIMGSYSENARVAIELKLEKIKNKKVKTETDTILIDNYTAHLNNIQTKRANLNKLLSTFNVEPILTNEAWNSLNGMKVLKRLQEIDNRYTVSTQPSSVGEAWMESKQGKGEPRLSENFARNSIAVLQTLRENINRLDLDIKVDLVPFLYDKDGNELAAAYIPGSRAIQVSLNGIPQMIRRKNGIASLTGEVADDITDMNRTNFLLYHEVMHVLTTEGFFKRHEFAALKEAATDQWIDRYSIRERYPENDKAVQDLIKQQGITYEQLVIEEAISEAFADYMTGRLLMKGPIARAFEKLKQYLVALGNALTANRFNSAESVFNQIDLGIVGERFKTLERSNVVYNGGINGAKIVVTDRNWSGSGALDGYNLIPWKRSFLFGSRQDKKINTKEFFNWFNKGGRESIVTTKNGAPLVVMHTTATNRDGVPFNTFDMGMSQDMGMHFTATQRHIDYIQQHNPADIDQKYYTFKGFLQLSNPYRMPDLRLWHPKDVIAFLARDGIITAKQLENSELYSDEENYKIVVNTLKAKGYDGIVYKNEGEDAIAQRAAMRPEGETPIGQQGRLDVMEEQNTPIEDSWIIFDSSQFKHVDNAGPYNTGNPNMFAARQWQKVEGGMPDDQYMPLNRQQERDLNRRAFAAKQGVDESTNEGAVFGGKGLSWINRWFGMMREWAKNNLPFAKLFTVQQSMEYKAKSLQAQLSNELAMYRLLIDSDPAIALALRKAQAISQWYQDKTGGIKFFKDANGQIILSAPLDFKGGPKDINIEPGEVVLLEGAVADAFLQYDKVMDKALTEIKKGEIAGTYIEPLKEAVEALNKIDAVNIDPAGPQLPWAVRNLSQGVLDFGFEEITKADLQTIVDELLNQATRLETIGPLTSPRPDMTMEEVARLRALAGFNRDGSVNPKTSTGLGRLLQSLDKYERMATGTYVPLMRFGQYYIKVVNPNKKEKEEGRTVEYIMFESKREAGAALSDIQNKYINDPNAAVSPVAKTTLRELKQAVKDKAIGVLDLAPYLSESNAVTFNALMKEVELLIKENKDVTGFDQFMTPRSVVGGIAGYSADFGRAAEQFIFMASRTAARNRFMPEARIKYNDVLKYADDNNTPRLKEGVKTFWDYVNDPKQEFATFRQIGFWWYLGGNMSSAILQMMSNVQFAGPMLAEITPGGRGNLVGRKGATAAARMLKAQKDAFAMLSFTNNQFGDTFIDWDKAPQDVKDFILEDMAGYLKQGQAMHEAGQVPGTENLGSRQRRLFRQFENAVIGGMFNTFEATSRLTSYIATMRTLMDGETGGQAIELARTLFEGDQLFQEAINRNGGVLTPQIIARHIVDDAFGVYGKLNRAAIMRKYGAIPALFQTYISQMFALMYRMLAKGSTPAQKAAGRRVFLRMMGMIVLTGGLFGIPGSDDAEDLASWMVENVPIVGTELKTDFRVMLREMLYDMGMGAQLVNAVENGFIEAYLNLDVQRRLALGNIPFSQQVRAITAMVGLSNGGKAADFAGAPGSVFMTPIKESFTAMREGRGFVDVAFKSSPLFIRNGYKAYLQSMGKGFVETNYGTVIRDDTTVMESLYQAMGFGSARTKRAREAEYMARFYETKGQKKQRSMNAKLTNAYRDIILGNKKGDSALSLSGQQRVNELTRELYKWNSSVDPMDAIYIDLNRAWDEAIKSSNRIVRDWSLSPQTQKRMRKLREMSDF